jgi:hypothetical protein
MFMVSITLCHEVAHALMASKDVAMLVCSEPFTTGKVALVNLKLDLAGRSRFSGASRNRMETGR